MISFFIFWTSVLLLAHSYMFYPAFMYVLSRRKKVNSLIFTERDNLPSVSVIISVYNEENSIEQRIHNIFLSTYPGDKMDVWIGSDGSTDNTPHLLATLQKQYPRLHCIIFDKRRGKGNVLNDIIPHPTGKILLFSDAKVLFAPQTIYQLVKHFHNSDIGIVGGNIVNKNTRKDGISIQENQFMSREIMIKYYEGKALGCSMGAYGACFAMRKELYKPVPPTFSVEDFYQTLQVLTDHRQSIMELNAICYENVPNSLEEEYRRKVRISAGNFQNMAYFKRLIFQFNAIAFCFFSHKVIRWTGPLLLITSFISGAFLATHSTLYLFIFFVQSFSLILPIIDFFLHKIHIHIIILRFVTHFYSMNLALLTGLIKHTKGINTNVWEPTTRKHN
jgi:cellulose synthase/poly-beta-1,6-N-acetylglucosamine synthase-like glycosyltransferase